LKISENIKELAELLQPLQQEDKNLHGTRADSHQYKLRPTLAEAELQSKVSSGNIKSSCPKITVPNLFL